MAHPQGPVHLDLPADEAARQARIADRVPTRDAPPKPSPSAVRSAAKVLAGRGRAVVLAGLGTREPRRARALQEVVEHLGSPVLTTPRAKGVIPEDHPLAAGVFAGARLDEQLLARADSVLVVGLDPAEIIPRRWKAGLPFIVMSEYPPGEWPFEVRREIIADLPAALQGLREALPPGGGWGLAAWADGAGKFKAGCRTLLAEASAARGRTGIPPHRVVEVVREVFPRETVATVDSGAHAMVVAAFWDSYHPKGYLCPAGSAGIGYALPAAVAAKLALPDRPVLAFLGDGGFLRGVGDLAMACWLGLPLVAVVMIDASLSLTRTHQERKRYAQAGVSLGTVDIPKLAESLGAFGTEVEDEEGLRSALADALTTTRPAIIAARVRPFGSRRVHEVIHGGGPKGKA